MAIRSVPTVRGSVGARNESHLASRRPRTQSKATAKPKATTKPKAKAKVRPAKKAKKKARKNKR